MKTFAKLSLILLGLFIALGATAQDSDELFLSIKNGDAHTFSKHLNKNIELYINNTDNVYSKEQTELILDKFFTSNSINSFTVIHQSTQPGSKYTIGKIKGDESTFRISFLQKTIDNQSLIYQLRIEEQ